MICEGYKKHRLETVIKRFLDNDYTLDRIKEIVSIQMTNYTKEEVNECIDSIYGSMILENSSKDN